MADTGSTELTGGTFGFKYAGSQTVDWRDGRRGEKPRWVATEGNGVSWHDVHTDAETMRSVLLERFGLSDWEKEFPWSRIETMPPWALVRARRAKEREHKLPHLEVRSDYAGYRVIAEDHR